MTVGELIPILTAYPSDLPVRVAVNRVIGDATKVDKCYELDTNRPSLVIYSDTTKEMEAAIREAIDCMRNKKYVSCR